MQYYHNNIQEDDLLPNPVHVAVYGTLKHAQPNHEILTECSLVTTDWCTGFEMVSLGAYPAALESPGHHIHVEVYEVKSQRTLDRLDALEGYPRLYDKKEVVLKGEPAIIYFMHGGQELKKRYPVIKSGRW